MRTDRELLELAAKAASLEQDFDYDGNSWAWPADSHPEQGVRWNPLTDDGDALRPACQLRIHVGFFRRMVAVQGPKGGQKSIPIHGKDVGTPTRRAIVLAAAEMENQPNEVSNAY